MSGWCREHLAPFWEPDEECCDCGKAHMGVCHEAAFIMHRCAGEQPRACA